MREHVPLVAIVDAEESVRRAILRLLRSAGYRAEAFGSAEAFLESLSRQMPACAVLDLHTSTITGGIQLQPQLRQLPLYIPVVVITAYDEPGFRETCFALGAERYLRKPIDGDILIETIERFVDLSGQPAMKPWNRTGDSVHECSLNPAEPARTRAALSELALAVQNELDQLRLGMLAKARTGQFELCDEHTVAELIAMLCEIEQDTRRAAEAVSRLRAARSSSDSRIERSLQR